MNPPGTQTESPTPNSPVSIDKRQVLTAIVSEICELDAAQIGSDFALASGKLRSSLGRAMLDAKIRRRLGVKLENLHTFRTIGEIEAALTGRKVPAPPATSPVQLENPSGGGFSPSPSQSPGVVTMDPATPGLACGIDIESVSSFDESKDYWEDPFYLTHFTTAEIAYCVSQPNPRMHFGARWCAKEALKKCRPEYLPWAMNRIEVVRREDNAPYLQVLAEDGIRVPKVALSLTHNADWALALVVSEREMTPVSRPDPKSVPSELRVVLVLSLAALACSILALILILMHT